MILDNPCDPDWRVLKESRSLAEAGFSVRILAWERSGLLPKRELIDDDCIYGSRLSETGTTQCRLTACRGGNYGVNWGSQMTHSVWSTQDRWALKGIINFLLTMPHPIRILL